MRKITLFFMALFAGTFLFAQEKGLQGTWWASSQIGYQQTKSGDVKHTNTLIMPLAGYFVSPTVTVGAA